MAIWSSLASGIVRNLTCRSTVQNFGIQKRMMSGKVMNITSSRWQWHKFKDLLHFYTLLGLIPVGIIVFYANVFIGPAKLTEIPEGYTPKHWEYYQHPITRWLARNVFTSPQQEYEKYLHLIYEEDEKMKITKLEKQITEKMMERQDYQAYYYQPISAKYARIAKKDAEKLADIAGFSKTSP
uniref:NADH dehydrogenase [ubiquinone] 1 beta subcomplex subunit 5, mitochondrial n=1 Tax=Triatoma infestans TaxID=30076 RepID=A0A023FCR7_TRIIF